MDKKFIEQAKNIRRQYVKNLNDVLKCEEEINSYKKELIMIQDNLKIDDEEILLEKMIEIEKNIKKIESIMIPFGKKVKELEKEADKLFENIKERYPNYSIQEIQNMLIPHLKEIKF